MLTVSSKLSERLRLARIHAGLTQAELGLAVRRNRRSVSALECGKSQSSDALADMAIACGVCCIWLEEGRGEMLGPEHVARASTLAPEVMPGDTLQIRPLSPEDSTIKGEGRIVLISHPDHPTILAHLHPEDDMFMISYGFGSNRVFRPLDSDEIILAVATDLERSLA